MKTSLRALENRILNLIFPFVHTEAGEELRKAFELAGCPREGDGVAGQFADEWFFETSVRLHHEGEGAPFTGLMSAELDVGRAVPQAEKALETDDPKEIVLFLTGTAEKELLDRFVHAISLKAHDPDDVDTARMLVEWILGFEVYSYEVYTAMTEKPTSGGRSREEQRH